MRLCPPKKSWTKPYKGDWGYIFVIVLNAQIPIHQYLALLKLSCQEPWRWPRSTSGSAPPSTCSSTWQASPPSSPSIRHSSTDSSSSSGPLQALALVPLQALVLAIFPLLTLDPSLVPLQTLALPRYKIQQDKNAPLSPAKLWKVVSHVVVNQVNSSNTSNLLWWPSCHLRLLWSALNLTIDNRLNNGQNIETSTLKLHCLKGCCQILRGLIAFLLLIKIKG